MQMLVPMAAPWLGCSTVTPCLQMHPASDALPCFYSYLCCFESVPRPCQTQPCLEAVAVCLPGAYALLHEDIAFTIHECTKA
jgi:hypothetical protein